MGTMPETRLVNRIRKAILAEWPDAWVVKVAGGPYQTAGIPDLLACIDGRLFGLEVKHQKPGESREKALARVTIRQQATIDRLVQAGAVAGTVLEVDETLALIKQSFK